MCPRVSHSHCGMNECLPCPAREQTGPGRLTLGDWGMGGSRSREGAVATPRNRFSSSPAPRLHPWGPREALPCTHPPRACSQPLHHTRPPPPALDPLPEASPSPPSWKRFCCLQRSCVAACEL